MCPKFWKHFGTIIFYGKIEQMCPKFGHIMDIFWIHFEFWTPYGHILDTFWVWTHFGHIMDTFWTLFKDKCPKCVRAHIVHQSRNKCFGHNVGFDQNFGFQQGPKCFRKKTVSVDHYLKVYKMRKCAAVTFDNVCSERRSAPCGEHEMDVGPIVNRWHIS